ncbi:MAG: YfiM family protein [Hyphomonas sp.]|jgi:hypothetical protein|nr:YfiM family protein [Hyphomonas sp.]
MLAATVSSPALSQAVAPVSSSDLDALNLLMKAPIPQPTGPGSLPVQQREAQPASTNIDFTSPITITTQPVDDDARLLFEETPGRDYASFGEDVKAIKWELAAVAGYYTATNVPKLFKDPRWPTVQNEGWFGRSTNNVGVDKLAHAYSTYVVSEILHARLRRKTGDAPGIEWTAAALASGIMLWSEAFDSIEPTSGWSWQDVTFNTLGAGFSVLRNSVPGLDRKLDFRLMIQPNEDIYTLSGKEHFRQQRYLFALKASGFKALENTPLRFVELHLGYRGDDFLNEDRAAGIVPKRHIFVGLGLNLRELLFKDARSRAGRAAGEVLDYFQPPYTAIHHDITE